MPTQREYARKSRVRRLLKNEAPGLRKRTARTKAAGIEAKRKNLGPQNHPPYHAHQGEYRRIRPPRKYSHNLYTVYSWSWFFPSNLKRAFLTGRSKAGK